MEEDNTLQYEENDDQEKSDNLDDEYILSKERISEVSKNSDFYFQQKNRFTEINKNFEDNQEDEENSLRQSNIMNNEHPKDEEIDSNVINNNKIGSNDGNINNDNIRKTENKNRKTRNSIKNIVNIKIILLGDVCVGKTSIIGRYINNSFEEKYKCTIQAECKTKIIDIDSNIAVKMNIWDTCGQEKFRILTKQYYRESHGAIIVFDLTNRKSFEYVKNWIEELHKYAPENVSILIVGNKSDLTLEKKVNMIEIKKLIETHNFLYYDVSAKNGNNISLAFDKIRAEILDRLKNNNYRNDSDIRYNMNPLDPKALDKLGESVNKSKRCC